MQVKLKLTDQDKIHGMQIEIKLYDKGEIYNADRRQPQDKDDVLLMPVEIKIMPWKRSIQKINLIVWSLTRKRYKFPKFQTLDGPN